MPQLDVSSYYSQIFWLIISVGILYVFVRLYFIPRLKKSFFLRDQEIEKLISESKKLYSESVEREKEYNAQMQDLHLQLLDISNKSQEQCQNYLDTKMAKLKSAFEEKKHDLSLELSKLQESLDKEMDSFSNKIVKFLIDKMTKHQDVQLSKMD